jgi:menaquinone-dependent protoporphyrinogen oxidase
MGVYGMIFAGRMDKGSLRLGERAIVRALRVPQGDFRGWTEIRQWGERIGAELTMEWSPAR